MSTQWRLIAYSDAAEKVQRRAFGLQPGENRIGRSSHNEITIPTPKCSRHHCSIFLSDEQLSLVDCSQNGTYVNGVLVSKQRYRRLKENDIISFGFDMTGEFNEHNPNAFIYTLIREEAHCIELSDSEDESNHSKNCHVSEHDETIENVTNSNLTEFKREVLITVTTQPMVINPFAVLKEREMQRQQQQQQSQPERGESTCLEPNADVENNATNTH